MEAGSSAKPLLLLPLLLLPLLLLPLPVSLLLLLLLMGAEALALAAAALLLPLGPAAAAGGGATAGVMSCALRSPDRALYDRFRLMTGMGSGGSRPVSALPVGVRGLHS